MTKCEQLQSFRCAVVAVAPHLTVGWAARAQSDVSGGGCSPGIVMMPRRMCMRTQASLVLAMHTELVLRSPSMMGLMVAPCFALRSHPADKPALTCVGCAPSALCAGCQRALQRSCRGSRLLVMLVMLQVVRWAPVMASRSSRESSRVSTRSSTARQGGVGNE